LRFSNKILLLIKKKFQKLQAELGILTSKGAKTKEEEMEERKKIRQKIRTKFQKAKKPKPKPQGFS
jgi:hypothetical protein